MIAGVVVEKMLGIMVDKAFEELLKDDSSSSSWWGDESKEDPYKYSLMTNYTLYNKAAPELSLYSIKHTDPKTE